jgi:branched-chain amino acid transport system substrate-binding protein
MLAAGMDRRRFIQLAGATGAAASLGPLLAACGGDGGGGGGRTIKIGYVSPQTGPLAGFGEADTFVVDQMREHFQDGIGAGGSTHELEIVVRDSQSDPNRAAEVAGDLTLDDGVDLVLVAGTPENVNPVADSCEANGVPCISSVVPWQPYFFGRQGDPEQGFRWTYHFFWGLEDIIAVFVDMWGQLESNKVVGALWPNDGDGNAWSSAETGFPPALTEAGYRIVDPGRYPNQSDNFAAQISRFKSSQAEIVTGVPIPPDFTTFWTQSAQQGFHPKIASIGKALLFPSSVEALGDLGDGLSTEVWWSPRHPYESSLTGQSAQELADAYSAATDRQWTQPIGFVHALFEVAADVLGRADDIEDRESIVAAVKATDLATVVGGISWTGGPVPNVAKTKLVGGQWGPGGDFRYDLKLVSNKAVPELPVDGMLRPIPA